MKLVNKFFILFFTVILLVLTGCREGMYHQTEGNVADVVQRTADLRHKADNQAKKSPTLVVNQGLYVDQTPISLARDPVWLKNKIILRGDQLPFSYYSRTVASGGGKNVLTRYQVGLDPNATKISLNYSGTVKGALDMIAAKTGYIYTVNGNDIYWQAFVTKTFDIAFMPGSSDYMMGKTGGGTSTGSTGGASGGTASAMIDDSSAGQYSNLKGTLSVWQDLQTSISQLLSPEGKVMVSQATTTVTVRDRPTNVDLVSQFVVNLNHNLSKQVLVKIQVLQIDLTSAYNFGINWNAVKRSLGENFVLQANYGTPVSISPLVTTTTTSPLNPGTVGLPIMGGQRTAGVTGVTALINALSQQGKLSIVTEPRVVALNNQVSVVRIVNQQGYIASVQTTSFSGATSSNSNNSITTQVTPGTLVTGVTLYILPKIMGDKVYLQVNADLSNSLGIDTLSSTTGAAPTEGAQPAPVIQAPKLTQKQFNQRSVIGSGSTLILSGFREVANQTGAMQLFNSQELGGKGAAQRNQETIVLITPIILHGSA